MPLVELFKNNRSPSLPDTITVDGAAFPLTTSTVKFQMRNEATDTLKVDAAATVVDAPSGAVRYDWQAADVDTAGRFMGWWHVTLPSGFTQDTPEFIVQINEHSGTKSQITVERLRAHFETGIDDVALGLLLDDAVDTVVRRFGDDSEVTRRFHAGGQKFIKFPRPVLSVSAVAEFNEIRSPLYTLTTLDWELQPGGRMIERLEGGFVIYADRKWAPIVDITYIPKAEQIIRDRVIMDLVRLATQYSALEQENVGGRTGYINMQLPYLRERERLMMAITNNRGYRFA